MGASILPGVIDRELAQLARQMSFESPLIAAGRFTALATRGSLPNLDWDLPVSDHGIEGATPLGPAEWTIPDDARVSDAEWSTQNRRVNDVLAGRPSTGMGATRR